MTGMAQRAGGLGREAHARPWFETAIRAGLVAYGVVHLLVGWLALQLALGDHEGSPSGTGAMRQLAEQLFGAALLWAVGVGMVVLMLWRLLDAVLGHREEDGVTGWGKRLVDVIEAAVYGAIGVLAITTATGSGSPGGGTDSTTKRLMDLPAGQWLVVLVGLVILGVGGNHVRLGWTEDFREEISAAGATGRTGTAYVWLGKAGYAAKGVALGIVGVLFAYAGITHEPQKSGGLDQALRTVLEQPFGRFLLGTIAVGIICFGLFCFARARHLARSR
jgi:amino acid transporter